MRFVRHTLWGVLLACGLTLALRGGEYRLENGNTLRGEIASADEDGLVVKLDVGGFSKREPWVSFAQATLRELAKDSRYATLVEPFIELAPDELEKRERKREVVVKDVVNRIERLPGRPSLVAGFFSPIGLVMLALLMGGNLYAAYEIARFRGRPSAVVCAISFILPLLGPILFLSLPGPQEAAVAADTAEEALAASSLAVPTGAERGGGTSLSLAAAEKPVSAAALTQPQVYQRGENTFNRRFFETKFPGFFRVVLSDSERDLVLVLRTPKNEFVGRRISRISTNELHLVLLSNNSEVSISFNEITGVILKHKDAKV